MNTGRDDEYRNRDEEDIDLRCDEILPDVEEDFHIVNQQQGN